MKKCDGNVIESYGCPYYDSPTDECMTKTSCNGVEEGCKTSDITVSVSDLKTFYEDVSEGNCVWSDSSGRLLKAMGIDPTEGL